MDQSFEELVSKDVYLKTLNKMKSALDEGQNSTFAFGYGVSYAQGLTRLPKIKIEKALANTLTALYGDEENPFENAILFVSIPWYTRRWWVIQIYIKEHKMAFLASLIGLIVLLFFTNPSPTAYKQHIAFTHNVNELYIQKGSLKIDRKFNFLIFSVYTTSQHEKSIGILGNFLDI